MVAILAFIIIATGAAYWSVLGFGFVNHDDILYVTNNPYVQKGLSLQNIVWAFASTEGANWHPLTWISHMLDVSIYGFKDASGHHLTNLCLHIINSCLLFVLLIRTTGKPVPSALVAVFFALHPMHVESVAWISERKDVLSTMFFLLTLWAWSSYANKPVLRRYLLVFGLLALGLMSKPMLVTLPFVLLLLDASQTAGCIELDVNSLGVDLLAAPGHKGLLGPQGTGILYVRPGLNLTPLIHGGTGSHSVEREMPPEMRALLEGTGCPLAQS